MQGKKERIRSWILWWAVFTVFFYHRAHGGGTEFTEPNHPPHFMMVGFARRECIYAFPTYNSATIQHF